MNNMVEFATRMKAQREKLKLTQFQLGEKIGVSAQTISAYEKNTSGDKGKTPTLDKVISIAQVLGVSIDFLCGTAPAETEYKIENLRDIAECLIKISRYVRCYGNSKMRKLTEEEELEQMDLPPELQNIGIPVAVFTLDNPTLAKFFETKNKLMGLYKDGTLTEELYNTIIEGQLATLQSHDVHMLQDNFDNTGDAGDIIIKN